VTHRLPLRAAGLLLALALTPSDALAQASDSASPTSTREESIRTVRELRLKNKPEEAVQASLRGLKEFPNDADLLDELRKSVRQALQANRHRDPQFQSRILAMTSADVLALYHEVLVKIQAHYVDADKVTTTRLFAQGVEEYLAALGDPNFVTQHVKGPDESGVGRFRDGLRKAWSGREVTTPSQAFELVAEIGATSKRLLGLRSINPVVCEFICGACNCLDEYSAYLSASQYMAESAGPHQMSVHVRLVEGAVAYMRITHFQPSTPQEVEDALKDLTAMGSTRALVLDLRGNTGGLFTAAVKTAEKFLPGGIIVTAQGQRDDANKVYTSTTGNAASDLPLVVLVDGETASAAEVLAVALRDNHRGKLVGTATFGKGTVQKVITFTTAEEVDSETGKPRPRAAVRITLARLIAPSGAPITGVGVTPDQLIPDRDRQFDTALEQAKELARRYMSRMGMMNMGMRMGE
jgi:Peptidase family S41